MAQEWIVPDNFPTINLALADASVTDYDTIRVRPGLYTNASEGGPIIITKMIQLLGAQAGVDARIRPGTAATESIVEIVTGSGSIQVNAENVVVDGFTVRNNTQGFGINTFPTHSGYYSDMGTQNLYIESNRFTGHSPAASINLASGSSTGGPPTT